MNDYVQLKEHLSITEKKIECGQNLTGGWVMVRMVCMYMYGMYV